MNKYLIIGGGNQGLTMATHLSMNGEQVNLWNRTFQNIIDILKTHEIHCEGIINGKAIIKKVSCDIDEVMEKIILIATPATAHRDIAKMLASRVNSDNIIILNPGRTFGAVQFKKILEEEGCKSIPKIAETQTIVYTCRRDEKNNIKLLAIKNEVKIAALEKKDGQNIIESLPNCLKPYFKLEKSILETSLNNMGMLLHCAPTLMNVGWIENPNYQFKYYSDGISESVAQVIKKIDEERISIGKKLDINLETIEDWLERTYKVKGNLLECLNNKVYKQIEAPTTINYRYLNEDVPYGLVPLENLAKLSKINTPYISTIITFASLIMKKDYRNIGIKINEKDLKKII